MATKKIKIPDAEPAESAIFKLSKTMISKLPVGERLDASAVLWEKSAGMCALCGNPLDLESKDSIVPDHRIPEAKGGGTTLDNLYLAHRTCNSSRQHLDFEVAQPLAKFQSIASQNGFIDFDGVLDAFVQGPRKSIAYEAVSDDIARIGFGGKFVDVPLWVDPATNVKYFFVDVPTAYILNDRDIQPRKIMPNHVRRLAIDFLERPVHEPGNSRLIIDGKAGRLLQFDGQHKATAQILVGRKTLQMKVYVQPSIDMLQALVIKIQQEIKKQPLTKSDTLAKINDVMQRYLEAYVAQSGGVRSEIGLISSQEKEQQKVVKSLYFDDIMGIVFFDPDNNIAKIVRPGSSDAPTTDKVVIQKLIAPLMYLQPLDVNMDESNARDIERENILFILNAIADSMFTSNWNKAGGEVQKTIVQNFFYQGSIGWWMNDILVPSLRYVLLRIGDKTPLLTEELTERQREHILTLVKKMCSWPIWSTKDPEVLRAMRSNTVKNVRDVFPGYSYEVLLKALN
ncbi:MULTISPECIES: HNH endonuclease [Stenotrophomonas maltophilia group]|uniref:HNH endonuclease n=1 Tax=Stenotrophomonas maltophilia group TaxID=995085 RepID=UPI001F535013|nr:HNH endonuclease signature motif containing protein [Stenotrophomonas sepilia]MCI1151928.1 HNH endonuclease [Stenotrophomonas maltophilia]